MTADSDRDRKKRQVGRHSFFLLCLQNQDLILSVSDTQPDSYLFVYGSLRNLPIVGQQHQLLHPAEHVGRATLPGKLFFLGHYPGAVLSKGSDEHITGEVYHLLTPFSTLEQLDDYEGCNATDPNNCEFHRERVEVHLLNTTTLMAWVYLYNRPTEGFPRIDSGDYLDFVNGSSGPDGSLPPG